MLSMPPGSDHRHVACILRVVHDGRAMMACDGHLFAEESMLLRITAPSMSIVSISS